jgi:excisionase family DNA binding protein
MSTGQNQSDAFPAELLTVSEVARLLRVHPNTLRLWSNRGLLKTYRIGYRRDRRFRRQDIDSFLESNPPVET